MEIFILLNYYFYICVLNCDCGSQVVKAFIVLTADYVNHDQQQLIEQLQEHVRNTTAPYKYPRKVSFEVSQLVVGQLSIAARIADGYRISENMYRSLFETCHVRCNSHISREIRK